MRRKSSDESEELPASGEASALEASSAATASTTWKPPSLPWLPHWNEEEEKNSGALDAALASSILFDEGETKSEDAGVVREPVPATEASQAELNQPRRRQYGPPRVSEEHKRERNRVTFKRFYHRKQQIMRELRLEEERLTQQYQQLLLASPPPSASDQLAQEQQDASYMDLVRHKDHLQAQNAALVHEAQQNLKAQRQFGRLVETLDGDEEAQVRGQLEKLTLLKRTSSTGHDRIIREAVVELTTIEIRPLEKDDLAFGWQCRRQDRGQSIEYTFKKRFTSFELSAEEIAHQTWKFCTASIDTKRDRRAAEVAPSSVLRAQRRVVETLHSKRECVVYRVLTPARRYHKTPHHRQTPHQQSERPKVVLAKSVYVVSMLRLVNPSRGFAVVSRSVDNQEDWCVDNGIDLSLTATESSDKDEHELEVLVGAVPAEIHEQWLDELSWWRIEPLQSPSSSVEVSFAGRLPHCLELESHAWFMELLRLVVQWEQAVMNAVAIACPRESP